MEKQEYKLFFENLDLIKRKYDILHSFEDGFNIFSILRNERDEVNLHSKFIGELFKNRSFGDIFLQLFIENKIDAGDQYKQIERYVDAMKKERYSRDEISIVYLTLDGEIPSDYSLGYIQVDEVKILSYKDDIISWMEKCIKEVAILPSIRETLIQYKKLLEKLTGKGEKKMIDELKETILSKEKYLSVAYLIPDILLEIKGDLQYKFWEKLELEMKTLILKYNFKIEYFNYPNEKFDFDKIKKFYTTSTNRKFYGLMYEVKELEDNAKLYLRIEVNYNIYWGLRVLVKI